jgi:hypothetical protein
MNSLLISIYSPPPSKNRGLHNSKHPRNCNWLRASGWLEPDRLVPVSNGSAATLRSFASFKLVKSRTFWKNPSIVDSLPKLFFPTDIAWYRFLRVKRQERAKDVEAGSSASRRIERGAAVSRD